jgi:hypothetical protein
MRKLTKKQQEVVQWLCANNYDETPNAAVNAGLISDTTLYNSWKLDNVKQWCIEYKANQPDAPLSEADIQQRLSDLVPDAIEQIRITLKEGKGDKVATSLAQWILKEVCTKPTTVASTPDEDELANLIKGNFNR